MAEPTSFGSLIAGATAATVVDSIIFPLDTIKTRRQSPGGIAQNGGYRHLYRGIASVASCTIPSASIFFFSYEKFKYWAKVRGVEGWKGHLLASSLAETISCAVLAPAEIVKQRAQVSDSQRTGAILRELIVRREGRVLWNGYLGLLARNVPVTAIQFVLYEDFKGRYRVSKGQPKSEEKGKGRLGPVESGLCAGLSGSIAAAITTPMDVIKTRVMVRKSGGAEESKVKGGMISVARKVVKEEGVKALFRGIGLRVLWTSVGLSLYLGSYEAMKNYIDGGDEEHDDEDENRL